MLPRRQDWYNGWETQAQMQGTYGQRGQAMGSKVQRTLGTFHIRGPRSLTLRWVAREVFWGDTELAPPPPQRSAGGGLPVRGGQPEHQRSLNWV